MLKRLLSTLAFITIAGLAYAAEPTPALNGVVLEYMGPGVIGFEAGVSGGGMGIAATYLPFRLEFAYYRLEDEGGDERKELDINTAYLGYRWAPIKYRRPQDRLYFSGLYIDTGLNVGSKEGQVARLKNPSKGWNNVGPGDIIAENIQKGYVAGVIGPVVELTAEGVMVFTLSARAHIEEEDPFIEGGVSFGVRF